MRKKTWLIFAGCLLFALLVAPAAWAHQPRRVLDNQLVLIKNAEVSQAFYGELKGHEASYLIDLKQAQDLYLKILVPDLTGNLKDKSVEVEYLPALGESVLNFIKLDADTIEWKKYYEEFSGDNYYEGPEAKQPAEAGYYLIKIYSPDNQGKYVLVVGEKEEWTALETIKAAYTVPLLKKDFFEQPISRWFNGQAGKYAGGGLLGLIILVLAFNRFNKVIK